jgi:hypothetical protein
MKVETYEIEDSTSEASAMANDSAAMELIEKLGLAGQKAIANPDTVTRIPYRAMEAREELVWRALCDASERLEHYQADAIPLRVLQAAAFAKETGMFKSLEVWYPKVARIDDPILVGITTQKDSRPEWHWNTITAHYLIARWGKSLLPFDELEALAVKQLKTIRRSRIANVVSLAQAALSAVDSTDDLEKLSARVELSL